jgi:hypothetical protein
MASAAVFAPMGAGNNYAITYHDGSFTVTNVGTLKSLPNSSPQRQSVGNGPQAGGCLLQKILTRMTRQGTQAQQGSHLRAESESLLI